MHVEGHAADALVFHPVGFFASGGVMELGPNGNVTLLNALAYADNIIATLREPFVVLDKSLWVQTANASFYRTFHVSKEETENHCLFDLGNGQWDIPQLRKVLDEVLSDHHAVEDFEIEHAFPTIGKKVMLLNARRIVIADSGSDLILLAIEDVTEHRRAEEQFRQAKKMEAIGRLAGGVAHAFNNLMTVVLSHSEIMLDGMKPGDHFFASAQAIERAATRTATLTKKLLAFCRQRILTLRPVDLNAVVGRLTQVNLLTQGGIRLDLSLEPGLGPTRADQDQLEEAILTLVRNACEAMPHGGRLTIQTANVELGQDYAHDHPEVRPGPYVLLTVSDTGVGMAQEALSHLFEPFYTKEAGVGAGLGLAAVYGFVKQCGGDIEMQSQPDKGTTFRLYLPREEGRGSEEGKPPA